MSWTSWFSRRWRSSWSSGPGATVFIERGGTGVMVVMFSSVRPTGAGTYAYADKRPVRFLAPEKPKGSTGDRSTQEEHSTRGGCTVTVGTSRYAPK